MVLCSNNFINLKELNSSYLVCLKLIKCIIKGIETANNAHKIDGDKNVILQGYSDHT